MVSELWGLSLPPQKWTTVLFPSISGVLYDEFVMLDGLCRRNGIVIGSGGVGLVLETIVRIPIEADSFFKLIQPL